MLDLLIIHPTIMMNISSLIANGPLSIASFIDSRGYSVKLIDNNSQYRHYSNDELVQYAQTHDPRIVGIGINSMNAYTGYQLLHKMQGTFDKLVIGGGLHSYDSAMEMIEQGFDIVFKGEAELSIDKFLCLIKKYGTGSRKLLEDTTFVDELGKISGILFRTANGKVCDTGPYEYLRNLDELPLINHDLVNMEDYIRWSYDYNSVANFLNFQRGCPFSCTYCKADFMGIEIRHNSAQYMFHQLKALQEKYNLEQIYITDSNFPLDKKRMTEFCNLMIDSGLSKKVKIWCQTSVTIPLSNAELDLLLRAGVVMISVGIERFDSEFRRYMNKAGTSQQALEIIQKIKQHGIKTNINILVNFPNDTEETLKQETKNLEKALPVVDYYAVNYLCPLPGTRIYKEGGNFIDWYLRPEVVNKIVSYYDLAYNVTTVGLEFNLFNLPSNVVDSIRRFKEHFYRKTVTDINQGLLFRLAYIADMTMGRISYYLYRFSPKLENFLLGPLKFFRIRGGKYFLAKYVYGKNAGKK